VAAGLTRPGEIVDPRYAVLRIDDVEPGQDFAGLRFRPLRPLLGIEAFGVAGWVADAGEQVIVDHTEPPDGQEELYVVLAGRARFAIGEDEQVTAAPGTCVAVRAGVRRRATAEADGTSVLAVGAPRGAAYSAPGWEHSAVAAAEYLRGDFAAAATLLREAECEHPDVVGVVYNLACCEALSGERDDALEHLRRAVELEPRMAAHARSDADLDSIRDDPRFAAAVG
jgi:mannose-6-phosphate isomerase-like protein (cupin superfamily)